ncbi:tetratricopeptide repeat protein [Phycisphaerales bacterium ac7]
MNVLTLPATSDMSESASDHLLATLLYNNGLLFLDRGHPEEALRAFTSMLRYQRYRSAALLQAARAAHRAGQSARAAEYVQQAQSEGANPIEVVRVTSEIHRSPGTSAAAPAEEADRKGPTGLLQGWVDSWCCRLEAVVNETCQDIRRGLS